MLHLSAGKYAAYLWPAYALSVVVLSAMLAETLAQARRWRRAADRKRSPAP